MSMHRKSCDSEHSYVARQLVRQAVMLYQTALEGDLRHWPVAATRFKSPGFEFIVVQGIRVFHFQHVHMYVYVCMHAHPYRCKYVTAVSE